jgi:large conductance mechanosensitive channel
MPIIALVLGKGGISDLTFMAGETIFPVGLFLQAVVDFILIAFVLFLVIRTLNRMNKKKAAEEVAAPEEIILLREIRDALKK